VLVCWFRHDGTDGRLFGKQMGGGEISYWCVRSDMTGRTADSLVGSWVGERYAAGCVGSDLTGRTEDSLVG